MQGEFASLEKKSRSAAERDEAARAVWREGATGRDPADLVFLDETATHLAMPLRVSGAVPRNHG